ncbi:uncharacterized protein [Apteryx mantelli]|uniref:Uncharacterized protein n=1 Tax=Apteryx mantelli TaxID=2696672 RepID=A0A8B7IAW2_9AVES
MDKGNSVKLVLTVNGQLLRGISSSTPTHPFLVLETIQSPALPADDVPLSQDLEDPTVVKNQSSEMTVRVSRPERRDFPAPLRNPVVPYALKPPFGNTEPSESRRKSPVQLRKPRKVLFEPRASERELDEEDLAVEELQDSDFWFPVGLQLQDAMPSCLRGHTATYDPDTKRIYIFGGIREDKDYSSIYTLDAVTWKWLLVAAKGRMPMLAYHSATIYHKELFVFGGAFSKMASLAVGPCSNVLCVFNPEYEIWYQPILEGEKPLPRLRHSATLLRNKLLILGGSEDFYLPQ